MVYEWDEKRARRTYLTRMGLGLLGALAFIAVPTWIAIVLNAA